MPFIRIKWIPSGKGMRPYKYLVRNYREEMGKHRQARKIMNDQRKIPEGKYNRTRKKIGINTSI